LPNLFEIPFLIIELVWAVIPFKQIQQAKQRLAPILSTEERKFLSLNMLEDVLEAATASEVFDGVLVATNCEEAAPIIRRKGVLHLQTSEELGLNHAARQASNWLLNKHIGAMCLFPADIPLAKASEFRYIVCGHSVHLGMTIVPSLDKGGTNCLVLSPPNLLPFCFGADSYAKHLKQGLKLNLSCRTKFSDGIGLDIDTPNDLRAISMRPKQTLTQNYLEKIEIHSRLNQLFW
jgi:2-phospho-L-lactate guanylyltransferase